MFLPPMVKLTFFLCIMSMIKLLADISPMAFVMRSISIGQVVARRTRTEGCWGWGLGLFVWNVADKTLEDEAAAFGHQQDFVQDGTGKDSRAAGRRAVRVIAVFRKHKVSALVFIGIQVDRKRMPPVL